MKNAIGLLILGLLFRYGSADVSHLPKPGHNQYLPPPIQNLPIEQDYNGINSQSPNGGGYLPPHNGNNNGNRGYLPPYQDLQQHDHHHHQDQHQNHHHGQRQDHHQDHHHDHHHDHHQDHHHDHHHVHHQNHQNDQPHDHQQYQDPYDPNVEISYHNDFRINRPNDQSHGEHPHDHGHLHEHHDDHVQIDQHQLDPVFPSNFPIEAYLPPPTAGPQVTQSHNGHNHGNPTVGPTRGESHSISLVNYHHKPLSVSSPAPFSLPQSIPTPLTPVHNTNQQLIPPPHNGYHYLPPANPTESLYPNHGVTDHTNHGGPVDSHEHHHQGPQEDYLPPNQSNHGHPGVSNGRPHQESSHGNPGVSHHHSGHSHQEPHQDYLPPNQLNNGNTQRGYLPPTQSNHVNSGDSGHHHNSGLPHQGSPQQGYLPPSQGSSGHNHQAPQQDYLPPNHSNHGNPGRLPQQDYLPPVQNNHVHHDQHHPGPQQGYLPPIHSNQVNPVALPLSNPQTGQLQQDYLPPVQSNHAHLEQHHSVPQNLQQDYLPPSQENPRGLTQITKVSVYSAQPQQDYLPPLTAVDTPSQSGALHIVPPPQLGLVQQEPRSQLTVRGHVNVPLPIPQVGYFFVPGVVSTIPSLTEAKTVGVRPALNIPAIISTPQQPLLGPTQHISSPEYSRTFLLQNINNQVKQRPSDQILITPSIETLQNGVTQDYLPPTQVVSNLQHSVGHNHLHPTSPQETSLGFLPQIQSNLHTLVSYPQNAQQVGSQYLAPLDQPQNHHQLQQNSNQIQQDNQDFIPPDNLSNSGLSLQNIARTEVGDVNIQQNPINSNQLQDHHHHHHQNANVNRGYLPPGNHNHITSLQTYMNGVHPNDRYGSSQYQHPPPNEKGDPPPPVITSPLMYSKPSAIRSYAPGMAYRVSTNTPFTSFTPATYLPPVENRHSHDDQPLSIGFRLNEEAKRNLARIMPKDNTVFPLEELLDLQDNEIDVPQLMEQLRGRIRTVQIINTNANSVKNIKVLETADHSGVKTIKILGPSDEDPMGEHKVVRIISKGPHPDGILQTVKIFSDHKEVTLPTQNAYLPPPKAKETYARVSRHSQESHRSH